VSYLRLLESELQVFSLQLLDAEKLALATYCDEVARWNRKINLTALSGPGLVRRLVVEPVWIARQLQPSGKLVDIGSGNGSPAIPFQIVCPFTTSHLIEARVKRAAFLRHLAATLGLPAVQVHRARFEQAATSLPTPDWISLQAVHLTENLLDSIRLICSPTTSIVWITARSVRMNWSPVRTLTVPTTGTQVFLFQRDLS
jgi:16S rRNA (guanine527-N7)-methyltransferase